jgi:hypothetical protein
MLVEGLQCQRSIKRLYPNCHVYMDHMSYHCVYVDVCSLRYNESVPLSHKACNSEAVYPYSWPH